MFCMTEFILKLKKKTDQTSSPSQPPSGLEVDPGEIIQFNWLTADHLGATAKQTKCMNL